MTIYTAPTQDLSFVLHDVLDFRNAGPDGFADLDRDVTEAILTEAGKLASEVLAPLNAIGDTAGCTLQSGTVRTPPGFREAYAKMRAGGWMGLDADPAFGGQGMPYSLQSAVGEMFSAANMAFNMYQGLTHGAISALHSHGTDAQKASYLPNMIDGRWSGTMNLTEPQCGTDLGLIRTRAEPQPDGSYRLFGTKIWISAGEHDLTENIIHLVLARTPDAPEGVKGISLFIVPKFLPTPEGAVGARNAVTCGGLETKMGLHGNATCVMNYDGATGYLLGDLHKGLRAMFTMMNEARLGVALQGYSQAVVALQNAAAFARDRLQGRALTGARNPQGPGDPILVHPDVRRMLLTQKAFVEGARAFTLWGALLIDRARRGDRQADALISLLIPVLKGFLTDQGFQSTVLAQQTLGGAGYTRAAGLEQFVRDARITLIYEGTNGIQALDLLGRKLPAEGGAAFRAFLGEVRSVLTDNAGNAAIEADFLPPLKAAAADLQAAAEHFLTNGATDPDAALAGSHDFLHLFGHTCLGLMWTRMAASATAQLATGTGDAAFLTAKLATGRDYMARQLPATALHLARLRAGTVMALADDAF